MSGDDLDSIEKQMEALSEKRDEESLARLARLHIAKADAQARQFKASIRRRAALLAKKDGKP